MATKNNITEIVFILDRSGSMHNLEKDTIGGFNSMLHQQRKKEGTAYVSTVLFSDKSQVLHDRIPIANVADITDNEYSTYGCTALLDAIGGAIHHIANIHKYARPEDVPENTVFIIITDGYENASRVYSSDKVKSMIEKEKEKYGWEFLFIGANIDAVETAKRYGIDESRAANYNADSIGTEVVYDSVCCAVENIRQSKKLSKEWKADLDADYNSRKNS